MINVYINDKKHMKMKFYNTISVATYIFLYNKMKEN